MSRFSRTLLATAIGSALYTGQLAAQENVLNKSQELPKIDQCLVDLPNPENPNQQPINIEADSLEAIQGNKASYQGQVVVTQGKKRIEADSVIFHQGDNVVVAEGDVKFSDGEFKTHSDRATNNLNTDQITVENTQYKFLCEPGRGEAAYISRTGKAMYEIEDGNITSCPEDDKSWRMSASSIDVDQEEEVAVLYNPRFEIQNIPVFYLPMLSVPIGDTRKTGFLYPSIDYSSRDGLEAEIPFYWNLAPNYDLTTTLRHMEKRGPLADVNFRYLNVLGTGNFDVEYLDDDKADVVDEKRWAWQAQHSGVLGESWALGVDYSKVSDVDYFSDLNSRIGKRSEGQLLQEAYFAYRSKYWDAELKARDFQVLSQGDNLPYRVVPQLTVNGYAPDVFDYLALDIVSHASRFETDNTSKPSATRVHVEPGITLPIGTTWGSWTTEARLLSTHYTQDIENLDTSAESLQGYQLEESVSRTLPQFRSHAGIVLERDTYFLDGYTQTLEPQVQYLFVPEKEQNNIYLYDTTLLQTDYYGLFRSQRYSGVDRIAAANQFSYGATSRLYDNGFKERFTLSFGQIYYLDDTGKNLSESPTTKEKSNFSSWAVEMDFNYDDAWFYHGGVQYDIDLDKLELANSTLEYRFNDGFVQTNYRYVTKEYIDSTVSFDTTDITRNGISQFGALASYKLTRSLEASGQYFYDFTTDTHLEWLGRITYTDDCWYIGFTYSRQLDKWDGNFVTDPSAQALYEDNFSVNFGIIGFGTQVGSGSGLAGLTGANNSLGYGRPFFLNE